MSVRIAVCFFLSTLTGALLMILDLNSLHHTRFSSSAPLIQYIQSDESSSDIFQRDTCRKTLDQIIRSATATTSRDTDATGKYCHIWIFSGMCIVGKVNRSHFRFTCGLIRKGLSGRSSGSMVDWVDLHWFICPEEGKEVRSSGQITDSDADWVIIQICCWSWSWWLNWRLEWKVSYRHTESRMESFTKVCIAWVTLSSAYSSLNHNKKAHLVVPMFLGRRGGGGRWCWRGEMDGGYGWPWCLMHSREIIMRGIILSESSL